ncbi:hypothetical protein [Halovivax limisalsi]|uniref:hypothetical protein n=1 Tax=Halovivax limisalsi TaxID=1453760 RepID=UPI001FFCCCFF|nr:hypothetical protein [Halovivax limisalsi]
MTDRGRTRGGVRRVWGAIRSAVDVVVPSTAATAADSYGSPAVADDELRVAGFDGGAFATSAHLGGVDPSVHFYGVARGSDRVAAPADRPAVRADGAVRRENSAADGESDA